MNELASKALFDSEVALLDRLAAMKGWIVNQATFPILDITFKSDERKGLRIRLVATNWDDEPASVELLAPSGEYLMAEEIPKINVFNATLHPSTGRPFVCMVGAREYHTHSSHIADVWDNHKRKERNRLLGLTTQLWSAWLHAPQ